MRFLFSLTGMLFFLIAQAQDKQPDPRKQFQPYQGQQKQVADTPVVKVAAGEVVIHEDERITKLMADHAAHKQVLKGYRVQIYLGERRQAEEIRRSFLIKHPEVPAYLSYLAPNFRVRVGDLRDRIGGERLRQQLKEEFPGLYVVPDEIEMPRLEEGTGVPGDRP